MNDPQIFESMADLQQVLKHHVSEVNRAQARALREMSDRKAMEALRCYGDVEERARLEGVSEGFAAAAAMVDVPLLESV